MQPIRAQAFSFQFQWLRPLAIALLAAGLAPAITITVPCSGSGGGTSGLIAAIEKANSAGGANTINLAPGCVYVLTTQYKGESRNGLPPITSRITINGYGATIDGSHAVRIFAVAVANAVAGFSTGGTGDLTLNTVTVKDGKASYGDLSAYTCEDFGVPVLPADAGFGGGICVDGPPSSGVAPALPVLTLNHSTVTGNIEYGYKEGAGGGINNYGGKVTLNYSVVSENKVIGYAPAGFAVGDGGISDDGTLTLDHSTVTHNTVETLGGGGNADYDGGIGSGRTLIMRDSVVSYNVVKTTGQNSASQSGGVFIGGTALLERCVIRDNVALAEGQGPSFISAAAGGIFIAGTATLKDSLVSSNTVTVGTSASGTAEGGGIALAVFGEKAKLTLDNTEVHCNIARALQGLAQGGGIYNSSTGIAALDRSKVTENAAQGDGIANSQGGGIYNGNTASGAVTLTDSTVKDNHPNQCDPTGSVPGCSN